MIKFAPVFSYLFKNISIMKIIISEFEKYNDGSKPCAERFNYSDGKDNSIFMFYLHLLRLPHQILNFLDGYYRRDVREIKFGITIKR